MLGRVLLLCGSLKPVPGREGRSATRQLLKLVERGLVDHASTSHHMIDLRDLTLPFYDGRTAEEYASPSLDKLRQSMLSCEQLVVSAPAYWRSVTGALINAMNLVGGPLYDFPEGASLLNGKLVRLIVTGAEYADAVFGASQLRSLFESMGAVVHPQEILIGNLRDASEDERQQLAKKLYGLGYELSQLQPQA